VCAHVSVYVCVCDRKGLYLAMHTATCCVYAVPMLVGARGGAFACKGLYSCDCMACVSGGHVVVRLHLKCLACSLFSASMTDHYIYNQL
jgi:hypothetical protein